jgi:hypothetical protein
MQCVCRVVALRAIASNRDGCKSNLDTVSQRFSRLFNHDLGGSLAHRMHRLGKWSIVRSTC